MYIFDLLLKFKIKNCNTVQNSMGTCMKFSLNEGEEKVNDNLCSSLIGNLLYVGHTRFDITFAMSLLSFMLSPNKIQ